MIPELPHRFIENMKGLLGNDWPLFRDALNDAPLRAVRLHRMSCQAIESARDVTQQPGLLAANVAPLPVPGEVQTALDSPVPWMVDAYYIPSESALGKSIYHECGAFYIQEPSAMAAVAALNPQPGETVLDLCAAPGGKTTAISRWMRGQGLLVANEIHPSRVVTLAQNIERLGVPAVVCNESPDRLAKALPGVFDAILVDAPCSGEGMFRKDPDSRLAWQPDAPEMCTNRQRDILIEAVKMVKSGGRIVYSTCTFNPQENEQMMAWAVKHLPVELVELPEWPGWDSGRPDIADGNESLLYTRRLWPHRGRGEGHFVAALRVLEHEVSGTKSKSKNQNASGRPPKVLPGWNEFLSTLLDVSVSAIPEAWQNPLLQGNTVFTSSPLTALEHSHLRILRPGMALAAYENGRFIPHHSLAMALARSAPTKSVNLSPAEASRYLAGESLPGMNTLGYVWVNTDGLPLGWGKSVSGRVNNLYPKGLRKSSCIWSQLR